MKLCDPLTLRDGLIGLLECRPATQSAEATP